VAVIGLGAASLTALENLREEGFDAIGFKKINYTGGLWNFSEDDQTSVLASTVVNFSKERVRLPLCILHLIAVADGQTRAVPQTFHTLTVSTFSPQLNLDLVFLIVVASYLTGAQMYKYLTSHAQPFTLEPHVQLNASIQNITFGDERQRWTVGIGGETAKYFDKIVIANGGLVGFLNIPSIEGLEKFKGTAYTPGPSKYPETSQAKESW
jgi:dimethylaniline monooxygenase (N-oxide forming)